MGAKAAFERNTRNTIELADSSEAEPLEQPDSIGIESQGSHWKWRKASIRLPWWHNDEWIPCSRRKARDRMSSTKGISEPDPRGETETVETRDEISEERALSRVS